LVIKKTIKDILKNPLLPNKTSVRKIAYIFLDLQKINLSFRPQKTKNRKLVLKILNQKTKIKT